MTKPKKKPTPVGSDVSPEAIEEFEKGLRLLYQKDFQKAIPRFEAVLEGFPLEHALCDRARGFLRVAKGEITARAPMRSTRDAGESFEVGAFLLNDGDVKEALRHLQRAAEHAPEDGFVYLALASAQLQSGDEPAALVALQRAVQLDKGNAARAAALSDFDSIASKPEFQALFPSA